MDSSSAEDGSSEIYCCVCENIILGKPRVITEESIKHLVEASLERDDNKHVLFEEGMKVHEKCNRLYASAYQIGWYNRMKKEHEDCPLYLGFENPPKKLKLDSTFDIASCCLICGEKVSKFSVHSNKMEEVVNVRAPDTRTKLLQRARERDDYLARTVYYRIKDEPNLSAANAKYHNKCRYKYFHSEKPLSKAPAPIEPLLNVTTYLEQNDNKLHSLDDLMELLNDYKPHKSTLKSKLKVYYGDENIVFTSIGGKVTVVCFTRTAHEILYNTWYEERKENDNDKKVKVIKKATEILSDDIRIMLEEKKNSAEHCSNDNSIPDTLRYLLESLFTINANKSDLNDLKMQAENLAKTIMSIIANKKE